MGYKYEMVGGDGFKGVALSCAAPNSLHSTRRAARRRGPERCVHATPPLNLSSHQQSWDLLLRLGVLEFKSSVIHAIFWPLVNQFVRNLVQI